MVYLAEWLVFVLIITTHHNSLRPVFAGILPSDQASTGAHLVLGTGHWPWVMCWLQCIYAGLLLIRRSPVVLIL